MCKSLYHKTVDMTETAYNLWEAVQRIRSCDPTLRRIDLACKRYTDEQLTELMDSLLAYPSVITMIVLFMNKLTDKTGIKLARYLATSTTIEQLSLSSNCFGQKTYLAMAAALRINTSLKYLYLFGNQPVDETYINTEFINALQLNPNRSIRSYWHLFDLQSNDYLGLEIEAKQLGHPNLQSMLATYFVQAF